jgi:hypothetical protein
LKVLFTTAEAPDFLQDLVFHGLVKLLGSENVFDYPQLERFHSPAPAETNDQAMHFLNLPRGPHAGVPLDDLLAESNVVVGPIRGASSGNLLHIAGLRTGRPVAALDGWDDPYVRGCIEHVDVYFKRETLLDALWLQIRLPFRKLYHAARRRPDWLDRGRRQVSVATAQLDKLVPLPLAVIDSGFIPEQDKTLDLVFLGAATSAERVALVSELRRLKNDGYRVYVPSDPSWETDVWHQPSRLRWSEYMRLLSSSRICFSVRGLGYDTYRYWEIPYVGSLVLSEPPRTVIPNNFIDDVEAVFAPPARLVETGIRLLERDTQQIADAGRAKVLKHHTSVQRAEAVLARLDALRGRALHRR